MDNEKYTVFEVNNRGLVAKLLMLFRGLNIEVDNISNTDDRYYIKLKDKLSDEQYYEIVSKLSIEELYKTRIYDRKLYQIYVPLYLKPRLLKLLTLLKDMNVKVYKIVEIPRYIVLVISRELRYLELDYIESNMKERNTIVRLARNYSPNRHDTYYLYEIVIT